jgi:hypothetical protein
MWFKNPLLIVLKREGDPSLTLGMTVIYGICRWKKRRFEEELGISLHSYSNRRFFHLHFQNKCVMPSDSEASPRLILSLMIKSLIIIDVYKG